MTVLDATAPAGAPKRPRFAGLAEINFAQKKYAEALSLCNEAIDNNILMAKELDLRFTRARALAELAKYADAKKEFEEIAKTKMKDMTAADLDAAVRTIAGSARSMGVTVEGV